MSPEQARGEHIDLRADLFSLGCLLYELGTGFTPFQAINSTALLLPTVVEWPKPPNELNPDLPKPLCQLIVHLLSKEPEHRPDSAQQVAVILCALAQGIESPTAALPGLRPVIVPITDPGKKWRFWRKTLTAAFLVILVGGVSWWFIHGSFFTAPGLSGSWSQAPPLAQPRTHSMAVEMDGKLYLVGGVTPEKHLDTLEVLQPETGIWKALAPLPQTDEGDNGRSAASAGVIDGKIYLAGGWRHSEGLPTITLLIYDPSLNSWDVGPPILTLSGDSVAGVIGRKFYVLSGTNGYDGIRHLFHVYDPEKNAWRELQPAPRPHSKGAGGVIGEKLYVAGGDNGQGPTAGLDVYDPAAEVWTLRSPMSTPRTAPAAAVINGQLVVLGGTQGQPPSLVSVEAYDPRTDRWIQLPDLPDARHGATAATVGSKVYVLGGDRLGSNLDSVDVFTLSKKSH